MGLAALIVLAILAVCIGYALYRHRVKPVSRWDTDIRAGDKNSSDGDLSPHAYSSELLASPSDDSATDMLSEEGESRAGDRPGRGKSSRVDGSGDGGD